MKMRKTIGAYLFLVIMTNAAFAVGEATTAPERANPRYQECRNIVEGIQKLNDRDNHQRDLSNLTREIISLDVAQPKLFGNGYSIVIGQMSQYMNNGRVALNRSFETSLLVCEELIENQINPKVRASGASAVVNNVFDAYEAQNKQLALFRAGPQLALSSCLENLMNNDFSVLNCDPLTGILNQQVSTQLVTDMANISTNYRKTSFSGLNLENTNLGLPSGEIGNSFNLIAPASLSLTIRPPIQFGNTDFMNIRNPYSQDECNCVKDSYAEQMAKVSDTDQQKQKEQVTNILTNSVYKALGDKFINKFTSNFEDLNFFMSNNSEVFTSKDDALKLQCADAGSFVSAVEAECGPLSSAERDSRLQSILGVPFSGLESKLKELGIASLSVEKPGQKNADGTPKLFTRDELDGQRLVLLKDSKELKFMDQMLVRILKNPELNKQIMDGYGEPSWEITKVLSEWLRKNPEGINDLDADILDSDFGRKLKTQAAAVSDAELIATLTTSIDILLVTHPGLKVALKDKRSLSKFSSILAGSEETSAWRLLEEQKSLLNEDFANRCIQMKQDMAKAVCTPADQILKKVRPHEVESIVSNVSPIPNLAITQQVLCENKSEKFPEFTDLNVGGLPVNERSDYMTRAITPPGSEPQDFLTKGMKRTLGDSPLREYSVRQAQDAGRHRVSLSTPDRIGGDLYARHSGVMQYDPSFEKKAGTNTFVARENTVSPSAKSNQVAQTIAKNEKVEIEKPEGVVPGSDVANVLRNVASQGNTVANNTLIPSTVNMAQTNDRRDEAARTELREALSNNENKEKVNKLISNTDDSSVLELLRLKEEGAKDRLRILELANQNEKNQNEELERKLKKLEEKRAKALAAINEEDEELSQEAGPQRRVNQLRREQSRNIASNTQSSDQFEALGSAASQPGKPSAPVPVNLQGLRNAVLPSNASLAANSAGVRGPVVVTSKGSKVAGIEIKAAEMNIELLNYLSENQADITTLLKIKDSGMLYRYQVVENGNVVNKEILVAYGSLNEDVKKLIDEKISQSGAKGAKIVEMDKEILTVQRAYSYSALKIILGEQLRDGTTR